MSEAAAVLSQPELLDARSRPVRPELALLVKEKSYLVTGRLLSKDEELCRAVCRDLAAGLSGRKIAKKYSISRNSILPIERIMRERGELEPLKKAVLNQLDDIIYLGLERIREGIAEDEINPGQLPIPIAAMIDKKGQLEAGMVPGTDRTVAEVTAEQVAEAWQAMKRARVIECKSEANSPNPPQIEGPGRLDTAQDTSGAAPDPAAAGPAEGGGGSAAAGLAPGPEGNASRNLEAKDLL